MPSPPPRINGPAMPNWARVCAVRPQLGWSLLAFIVLDTAIGAAAYPLAARRGTAHA
ncbi:hypothetical protein SRABI26_02618 [Arthrobacter sp. Bi26]|nr:hypothetical protein SRABI26_02618 [Arthrobacter sp. Bi26]